MKCQLYANISYFNYKAFKSCFFDECDINIVSDTLISLNLKNRIMSKLLLHDNKIVLRFLDGESNLLFFKLCIQIWRKIDRCSISQLLVYLFF